MQAPLLVLPDSGIMFRCFADDAGGNKQKTAVKDTAVLDRETEELKRTSVQLLL